MKYLKFFKILFCFFLFANSHAELNNFQKGKIYLKRKNMI